MQDHFHFIRQEWSLPGSLPPPSLSQHLPLPSPITAYLHKHLHYSNGHTRPHASHHPHRGGQHQRFFLPTIAQFPQSLMEEVGDMVHPLQKPTHQMWSEQPGVADTPSTSNYSVEGSPQLSKKKFKLNLYLTLKRLMHLLWLKDLLTGYNLYWAFC